MLEFYKDSTCFNEETCMIVTNHDSKNISKPEAVFVASTLDYM